MGKLKQEGIAQSYRPAMILKDIKTMSKSGDLPSGRRHLYSSYKNKGIVAGMQNDKIILTPLGQRMSKIRKSKYIEGLY
jgi:hypothetical protein